MSWHTYLSRLKTRFSGKKRSHSDYNSLDQRLVKNTQERLFPSWSQLKYLNHFLSKAEKRLLTVSSTASILAILFLTGFFLYNHLDRIPKDGGEYSEAMIGQPKYINPLFASLTEVDTDLTSLIYAGLFRYNKDRVLTPELAASFTVSDDKKTYDITLRKDVRWSDGQEFTANDVIYTFEHIQNPEVGSPLLSAFQGVKIEKVDTHIVRFTLKEPFAPFIESLAVGIIPEHIWGEFPPSGIRLAKNNIQPVGAGAWQFNKLLKDEAGNIQSYQLTRNENYFEKKPYLKTLNFKFFNDYDQAIEAVRNHTVSALSFVPHQTTRLGSQNLTSYTLHLPQYTALFFNQEQASSLKNSEVRSALGQAIDKTSLIHEALRDYGETVDAPILKGSLGYYPELSKLTFNTDSANSLLDKKWTRIEPEDYFKLRFETILKSYEGELDTLKKVASTTPEKIVEGQQKIETQITESIRKQMTADQPFYRHDKDKKILSLTITTVDSPEYVKTAELISKMWNKIGIQTNVQAVNRFEIGRELLKKRSYDILLYGEIVGSDPDPFPFWHSSQVDYPGLNLAMFADRNADKLLEEARITIDSKKRADLYKKFQDILAKELPAIFLYSPTHTFVVNRNIKGITANRINAPSDRYSDIANWYLKTKLKWKT
ncbi:MAG: hypothetical protein A2754_00170 [Candidatus Magasanikbacteria bacterium RIFCSPHIGHO2_01_FULL_47_8]|uniref:Solute-binding protein family 5 domain-containing protein n=1 Tax=Candidatus Magasanikbacteria bacterium RIFCSPHIGHO2_01_FULL_47_8 TaxID=1798673 RepID=A0A1F6MB32_9BACT|nr:MAG: hypothetical protein A2754_00170 [Candidatus Magasanikbacteria bacterium RIFCSPHIGHO2_01_FULL_47_8]